MRDDEICIPKDAPKLRLRDQWAGFVHDFPGGPIVAYPVIVSTVIGAFFAILDVLAQILDWVF